jgi:hypothetical protein
METGAKVKDNRGAGVAFATPSQHPGVRSTERMTTPPDRTASYASGDQFAVPYPFSRDTYTVHDTDEETFTSTEVPTWRPGTRPDEGATYCDAVADGMGAMLITVVSVHKPGKFPTRVFFTRRWRDPDGREFGKGKLHIRSQAQFRFLIGGFRYDFEMADKAAR